MDKEPQGLMHELNNFEVTQFNNLKLEKIIICEKPKTKAPVIVFLKIESNNWHEYFLDAGLGFWHHCDEIDTDDDYNYIDKTNEYGLLNKVIYKIWCESHENNSQIIIEFKSREKLILRTVKPKIFDSESELVKL